MGEYRKFVHYIDENGNAPVEEFILGLQKNEQAKIVIMTNKLENELSNIIQTPYYKRFRGMGYDIGELRIGDFRIFVSEVEPTIYLMLHIFRKNTNKTPENELKLAKKRLEKYYSSL